MGKAPSIIYRLIVMAFIMTQSGCSDKRAPVQVENTRLAIDSSTPAEPRNPFDPIEQTAPSGLTVEWIPFGARLTSVTLPDGTSVLAGLATPEYYAEDTDYLGAMIGRVANRIGGAAFQIEDETFEVLQNEGEQALHSGPDGFDRQLWEITREDDELVFRHTSPAGHQGYPGNLDITVRSRLTDRDLSLQIIAITDAATPVNLTHHGYWNPSGRFTEPVNPLTLQTSAEQVSSLDERQVATGELISVDGTALDFRQAKTIGDTLIDTHLQVPGAGLREMARLTDGIRTVTVLSNYPGLQVYTGDAIQPRETLIPRGAVALEPQYPPNAINNPVDGHDTILRPGTVYRQRIIYRFDGPGFEGADQ